MDAVDRNFLRMSGRIRALEQLMTVLLIDFAERTEGDTLQNLETARKYTMLTVQLRDRPIDEAGDLEAEAMIETLNELFDDAKANVR